MTQGIGLGALAVAVACTLVGCGSRQPLQADTAPSAPPAAADPLPTDPQLQGYERVQSDRAVAAESQGRWADAALAWEVLSLLRPDDERVRDRLDAARRRIETLVLERQNAAVAAHRRGDLDLAAQAYLDVLALDPTQRIAADALRQIERDRNRRSLVGRFARPPAQRRSVEAEMAAGADSSEPARAANSQREHATMLARQGDVDGAIQLLRDSPASRSDGATRRLLADLYVQRAESLRQRQPEAARQAVDAALALERRHAGALALQSQLPKAPKGRPAPGAAASAPPQR